MHRPLYKFYIKFLMVIQVLSLSVFPGICQSHVFLFSSNNSNSSRGFKCKLESISKEGRKTLDSFSDNIIYGADDFSLAVISADKMIVINKADANIVCEMKIGDIPVAQRMNSIENLVAVHSEESTIIAPYFDGHKFACLEINWKTKNTRTIPIPYDKRISDLAAISSVPSGAAFEFFNNNGSEPSPIISMINTKIMNTNKPVLLDENNKGGWQNRQIYFAPGLGLMEYFNGFHYCIVDADESRVFINPVKIPSPSVHTPIFVTGSKRNCKLIWGGRKPGEASQSISSVIIFDLSKQGEVLKTELGPDISQDFAPGLNGEKIYFYDMSLGNIKCFDVKTQKFSVFYEQGSKDIHGFTIIQAY